MAEPWRVLADLEFTGREGARWVFGARNARDRLIVSVLEEGIVRVQVQPLGHATVPLTWAVVGSAGDAPAQGREREDLRVFSCPEPLGATLNEGVFTLRTNELTVKLVLQTGSITVDGADGSPLLRDHASHPYRSAGVTGERGIRHTLERRLDELYLGLGEVSGPLNKHHRRYRQRPADALAYDAENADPLYKHLPVYLTVNSAGQAVGLLYDTGAEAVFDFGREVDNYQGLFRYAEFESRELDYYVLAGPSVATVTRRIQELTGFAPLPPRWTLDYQGSTMSYTDAEDPTAALAGFVDRLRQEGIRCGGFNLSSGYSMGDDGLRYVFEWNRRRVPEPRAMTESLREAGIRTLANIKPALLTSHPQYPRVAEAGGFVKDSGSDTPYLGLFWGGHGAHLDFSDPGTYSWWRHMVRTRILENGIDATWNDNNEYQISDDAARLQAGEAGDLRPTLTLLMNMASRDAQRDASPQARDYQLTRSGSLGMQRLAGTWSGDNYTSWRTLRYNLPMGLGMSLSGWANNGHDVGGFAGPMPDAELLLRWVEAGVFQPRFCIHSWNDDATTTEPWSHPEVLPEIRRLIAFRAALVPYLYTLMHDSVWDGTPITRPFIYSFQEWRAGWEESFAYMLGDSLLVAPALEPGSTVRSVLLPPGRWLELQTGRVLHGDAVAELSAEPGWPPLLLREGHAVPLAVVGAPAPGEARSFDATEIEWLAFPDESGSFSGRLTWDDGLTRLDSRAQASTVTLTAAGSRVDGTDLLDGFEAVARVLAPGGTERLEWFRAGFRELRLTGT